MTIFAESDHPRVADGTFSEKPQTEPEIALGGLPKSYPDFPIPIPSEELAAQYEVLIASGYPRTEPYYERLGFIRSSERTGRELEAIASYESEEDFMLAVVRHSNATPEAIETASMHHSFLVRRDAAMNPNVAALTLERVHNQAVADQADAERRHAEEGVSPNAAHIRWEIVENSKLAFLTHAYLERKTKP
jgi:hypothetical protein